MFKKITTSLFTISILFTTLAFAQVGWERVTGLPGGNIKATAEFNSTYYAITDNNMYTSSDGQSWSKVLGQFPEATFLDLTTNNDAIWVSVNTQDKIFYSTDGQNWSKTNEGFEGIMFAFTLYGHKNNVYAYISDGNLYRKDGLDNDWVKLSQLGTTGSILRVAMADSLLFAYGNRTTQFGGSNFLVSADSGKTFNAMGKTDNLSFNDSFTFPSATLNNFIQLDDSLYSITANELGIFSIHLSDSLWDKQIPTGSNVQIPRPSKQAMDGDQLILATRTGLYKTDFAYENGETIGTNFPAGNIWSFSKFSNGSYLIRSQTNGLLYLQSETNSYKDTPVEGINEAGTDLVSDGTNLIASHNNDIYLSNDVETSWQTITPALSEVLGFEFFGSQNGGFGLFSGSGVLLLRYQLADNDAEERIRYFASENGGESWTKLTFGANISIDINAGLSITKSSSNYVISGYKIDNGYTANIYISDDLTVEESELVMQSGSASFDDISFFTLGDLLMRVTIDEARERNLLVSTNGGIEWELKELSVDVGTDFFGITDLVEHNGSYIAYYRYGGTPEKFKIFKSEDSGSSWVQIAEGEALFGVYQNIFNINGKLYLPKGDGTMAELDPASGTIEEMTTTGKDLFAGLFASYVPSGDYIIGFHENGIFRMDVNTTVSNEEETSIPLSISLRQNYPNPFNPSTVIPFHLNEANTISIILYDMLGRKVKTLINDQSFSQGSHSITFNAGSLSSGMYIYRLETNSTSLTRKMMLIK